MTFAVNYKDAAGNAGQQKTSSTDGTSVVADKTSPKVTAISIVSSNSAQTTIANLKRSDGKTALLRPKNWDAKRNVAIIGDSVTLTITADEFIQTPVAVFKSGGEDIGNKDSIAYNDTKESDSQANANKVWTCKYTAHKDDTDGIVTFVMNYKDAAGNAGQQKTSSTDGTSVITDN
eukprot:COSAG05_NODE_10208_length_577_cov_2.989540_1_plen_175_part_10